MSDGDQRSLLARELLPCQVMIRMSWKCTICQFVDGSPVAPEHCPECGARAAMFVASAEEPHGIEHNPLQHDGREQSAVIVGPGHGCLAEK